MHQPFEKYKLCEALLGFPVRHFIFTYVYSQENAWDGFLFEFMCLKFWKRLMWKLSGFSTQTHAKWVHKVVNECIMQLEKINFVKPSLDSLFGIPYFHMFIHKKLIWDGFLFEFMCLNFWKRFMHKLINISTETGAECMCA